MKFNTLGKWAAAVACVGMISPSLAAFSDANETLGQ